jgi:mycofactocin precursor
MSHPVVTEQEPTTETVDLVEGHTEVVTDVLVEEVSIDGLCGVY